MNCTGIHTEEELRGQLTADNMEFLHKLHNSLYEFGLPVVCLVGILGNFLILMTMGCYLCNKGRRETPMNMSISALAAVDLLFCISAFPSAFIPHDNLYNHKTILFYYRLFGHFVINVFILTSTFLTVLLAGERFYAIRYPLKTKAVITRRRTHILIAAIVIGSILFNFPIIFRFTTEPWRTSCNANETVYIHIIERKLISTEADTAYRVVWMAIGNVLPLILLTAANIYIIRKMRAAGNIDSHVGSSIVRRHTTRTNTAAGIICMNREQNITLVVIVAAFLILVAPSELSRLVVMIKGGELSSVEYKAVEMLFNFMQSLNFSINFILYSLVSCSFRQRIKRTARHLCCMKGRQVGIHSRYVLARHGLHDDTFNFSLKPSIMSRTSLLSSTRTNKDNQKCQSELHRLSVLTNGMTRSDSSKRASDEFEIYNGVANLNSNSETAQFIPTTLSVKRTPPPSRTNENSAQRGSSVAECLDRNLVNRFSICKETFV